MESLPEEITFSVLSHLDIVNFPDTLVHVSRTCKRFHRFSTSPSQIRAFVFGSIGTREEIDEDECIEYVFGALRMLQSKTKLDQKISCCITHGFHVALRKMVWRRARGSSDTASSILSILDSQRQLEGTPSLIALAVSEMDNQCLRVLLQLGADPTLLGQQKRTSLHTAAFYGNHEAIPLLVQGGCAVEAVEGRYMQTPLHVASQKGHVQCVEKLLHAGADPQRADRDMLSPLLIAAQYNQTAVVDCIHRFVVAQRQNGRSEIGR